MVVASLDTSSIELDNEPLLGTSTEGEAQVNLCCVDNTYLLNVHNRSREDSYPTPDFETRSRCMGPCCMPRLYHRQLHVGVMAYKQYRPQSRVRTGQAKSIHRLRAHRQAGSERDTSGPHSQTSFLDAASR
jgi:hypothetical protein